MLLGDSLHQPSKDVSPCNHSFSLSPEKNKVLMLILRRIGIDIAPIMARAGIVGLAIGFGAQELVRDFTSGFFSVIRMGLSF